MKKNTALTHIHESWGAKCPFAGYNMPILYEGEYWTWNGT
jgi:hypothetical protein